jgi:hypothetical protein
MAFYARILRSLQQVRALFWFPALLLFDGPPSSRSTGIGGLIMFVCGALMLIRRIVAGYNASQPTPLSQAIVAQGTTTDSSHA